MREFSTRRAEILERMEDRGQWSAKAAQAATLDTRRAKDYRVTASQLRDDWAVRAAGWAGLPADSRTSSTGLRPGSPTRGSRGDVRRAGQPTG